MLARGVRGRFVRPFLRLGESGSWCHIRPGRSVKKRDFGCRSTRRCFLLKSEAAKVDNARQLFLWFRRRACLKIVQVCPAKASGWDTYHKIRVNACPEKMQATRPHRKSGPFFRGNIPSSSGRCRTAKPARPPGGAGC